MSFPIRAKVRHRMFAIQLSDPIAYQCNLLAATTTIKKSKTLFDQQKCARFVCT